VPGFEGVGWSGWLVTLTVDVSKGDYSGPGRDRWTRESGGLNAGCRLTKSSRENFGRRGATTLMLPADRAGFGRQKNRCEAAKLLGPAGQGHRPAEKKKKKKKKPVTLNSRRLRRAKPAICWTLPWGPRVVSRKGWGVGGGCGISPPWVLGRQHKTSHGPMLAWWKGKHIFVFCGYCGWLLCPSAADVSGSRRL